MYLTESLGFMFDIDYKREHLEMLDTVFKSNNMTIPFVMTALLQSCDELIIKCRWENSIIPCNQLYNASVGYFGSCCSFNANDQIGFVKFK